MNCLHCKREISHLQECIKTFDDDYIHEDCENDYIIDHKRELGFEKATYEKPWPEPEYNGRDRDLRK